MSTSRAIRWTLFRFGFRQMLRSAVIIGVLAGLMLLLQGVAYQKAFGTSQKQAELAASLANAPALGFIYGDPHNLQHGTQGYMVYRVLGFMGVITAVWALMTITKLLRGAEEDGRYEVILAGGTTPRRAAAMFAASFAGVWWVALLISFLVTLFAVKSGGITTTVSAMFLLNIAIFLPALLFAAIGIFTSQLGLTRGRALLYGIVPLAALFLLRGMANTSHSLHWLLYWTPFGWVQLISPVYDTARIWVYVPVVLAIAFAAWGIQLTRRDYGSSIVKASTRVRSHFGLLKNAWGLSLRQNFWTLFGWALGAFIMISLIAGLTNTAVGALDATSGLSKAVNKLGGTDNIKIAFLSSGVLFMVMVLLVMSITIMSEIRRDEAKQYLDNVLVGPHTRTTWLIQRLLLAFGITLLISLLAGALLRIVAGTEHIPLEFAKVLATSLCVVGSTAFLIGLGALFYGFLPRLAVIVMYVVVIWSFGITLVASAANLNKWLLDSSLFQYTNFSLSQWPDWTTFCWFMVLAVVFSAAGVWAFNRRDIIPE